MRIRLGVVGLTAFLLSVSIAAAANSPVADAARRGDIDAVKALLKDGADVSAPLGDGMTALHWAAERGDLPLTNVLVYAGANVAAVTRVGQYTPLHIAARTGNAGIVKMLLAANAVVDARTAPSGATALHLAAVAGAVEAIDALLDAKADVNAKEPEWQQTPLIFAASSGRTAAVKALLARGAKADEQSKWVDLGKEGQLDRAARQLQTKILEATVPKGQVPTASQLQAATQAAREMLRSGKVPPPDPNAQQERNFNPEEINPAQNTKGGLTALHHAVRQGYVETASALIEAGADLNKGTAGDGSSPLVIAAINGQFDAAMLLIEKGADPNLAMKGTNVAPLWAAINTQWQPRTRFPQPQNTEQQKHTYLDVMAALLEKGADVNARISSHPWFMVYTGCGNRNCGLADTSGSTAFWRAAYSVDVEAMRLLAKHGADVNIPSVAPANFRRAAPPLPDPAPVAARAAAAGPGTQSGPGAPAGAQGAPGAPAPGAAPGAPGAALVGRDVGAGGAVPPQPDDDQERYDAPPVPPGGPGAFPIHAAAGVEYGEGFAGNAHRHAPGGWLPAIKYLVEELGADVNARDNDGYTALHHAAARGDNEVILYLVSKGADVKAVARTGQTTADMANSPVQRLSPIPETVALLMKLGSKNSNKCVVC